jgi:hypothetical protein
VELEEATATLWPNRAKQGFNAASPRPRQSLAETRAADRLGCIAINGLISPSGAQPLLVSLNLFAWTTSSDGWS